MFSSLTEERPLLLDPWRGMCCPIIRERQKGWPVSSSSLRWWECFHVCFWKCLSLWSVIILHCLRHQMRGRFYTTLPFLFVLCQQNLPLLWGVELGIMDKDWNIPQGFLLPVQLSLLPPKSLTPFSWGVDILQLLRRSTLSLGATSDNDHISIFNSLIVFDSVDVLVSCSCYVFNHRNYLQLQIKAIIWVVISLNLYDSI